MALRTGDRVHQETYGVGEIIDMSAAYVVIAFDDGSTRKFVTSRVALQPSSTPAPVKTKASRSTGKRAAAKKAVAAAKGAES
ncbi:MAG: hypothetical protein KA371_20425 [Acidobacteria bacterium]|nr:hypothetical protein [Acidobacteriota bacterium]